MITLKRLRANNFKGLREVDIIFPEQGSLLIEGHNEAGKSTLFEAVYVGLYGKPLVGEDDRARQEEVIQYNQPKATVELVVSIGQQILTITRIFERNKAQYATLSIQQPGMQTEMVTRTTAVNERILKELGNLDGESLRNSCFVEQKELGRIEALKRPEREQAIQKLLGLERLTKLMDEFKPRREQERELERAEKFLALAQFQAKADTLSRQESTLAERLDAIRVTVHLKQLSNLASQKEAIEQNLRGLAATLQQAQAILDRCSAIKEQITLSNQITHSLTEVAHLRRELNWTKEQLAQLEQREKVDLPEEQAYLEEITQTAYEVVRVIQARVHVQKTEADVHEAQRSLEKLQKTEDELQKQEEDVSRAQTRFQQRQEETQLEQQRLTKQFNDLTRKKSRLEQALTLVTQWEAARHKLDEIQQAIATTKSKQQEHSKLQEDLQQREDVVHNRKNAAEQAKIEGQQATEMLRQTTAYGELTAWIRLKGVEIALADYTVHQNELIASKQASETVYIVAQSRTRTALLTSIALSVLAILLTGAGFIWRPAFLFGILVAGAALVSWIWFGQTNKQTRLRSRELDHQVKELQQLDMHRQAAIQAGGDPAALQYHERQLLATSIEIPTDLITGQRLLENLKQTSEITDLYQARAREQTARENAIRLLEQLNQAIAALDESKRTWSDAQKAGNPTEQLSRLMILEAEQERTVTQAEPLALQSFLQDGQWPASSPTIQNMLSVCLAEIRSTTAIQQQYNANAARLLQEAQADLAKARETLHTIQKAVLQQRTSDPVTQLEQAQNTASQAQVTCNQQEEVVQQFLQQVHLLSEADVEPTRGRTEARIQACKDELATRPEKIKKCEALVHDFTHRVTTTATAITNLITVAQSLSVTELPDFPQAERTDDSSFAYEDAWAVTLTHARSALHNTISNLDEPGTKSVRDKTLGEQGSAQQQITLIESNANDRQQQISILFAKRSLNALAIYTQESVTASWPLVAQVKPEEEEIVVAELTKTNRELYATRLQENNLTTELHHPGTSLSIEECQQMVDKLREEREICLRGYKLLRETHDRIARRVLPITERNMQPLLQQLTGGRYRDVRLTPEDTNGQPGEMDYRIRVWDPVAGRFVAKNIFSGGTRDQCSLALRLAFALATLPQELGVAPGFIFLDEPLSAFDAQRAQALVGLLTTGTIAQQFSQVVLISHNHAFDRNAFRYHVRLEAGQIVESDLPSIEDHGMLLEAVLN
jgi:DNA repair exonuclease SbcCD ATPase subunit